MTPPCSPDNLQKKASLRKILTRFRPAPGHQSIAGRMDGSPMRRESPIRDKPPLQSRLQLQEHPDYTKQAKIAEPISRRRDEKRRKKIMSPCPVGTGRFLARHLGTRVMEITVKKEKVPPPTPESREFGPLG